MLLSDTHQWFQQGKSLAEMQILGQTRSQVCQGGRFIDDFFPDLPESDFQGRYLPGGYL
jgi:hypothetical protein